MARTFTTWKCCSNCKNVSRFTFPYSTKLTRGSITGTLQAQIPTVEVPGWKREEVICPKCGSDQMG